MKVRGPYYNKTGKRWECRWEDGDKSRVFSRRDRLAVEAKIAELSKGRQELRAEAESNGERVDLQLPELPEFGTPQAFKATFAAAAKILRQAHNDASDKGLRMIRSYISGMAELAREWLPISGILDIEQTHEQVLDYLEVHGHLTRREGAKELQPATPGLAEALGSSTGPFAADGGHDPSLPAQGRSTRGKSN